MTQATLLAIVAVSAPILVWAERVLYYHVTGRDIEKTVLRRLAIANGVIVALPFLYGGGSGGVDAQTLLETIGALPVATTATVGPLLAKLIGMFLSGIVPMGTHAAVRSISPSPNCSCSKCTGQN